MFNKELSAATAKPFVLSILSKRESYGYDIIQQVKELSGGKVDWAEGALYPVLHRMEKAGLVESYWSESETGRRRKYYRLLPVGKEQLVTERAQWSLANTMLTALWGPRLAFRVR